MLLALVALVAVVFWPSPESAEPGPETNVLQLERERGAAPRAGGSKNQSASLPSVPATPSPRLSPSPFSPASPLRAGVREEWTQKRSRTMLEERKMSPGDEPAQLRKLGAKERAKGRAEKSPASWVAEARLIDEIGIEAYDERLYQEGRSNRSEVNWVAPGSNAGQVGIQKGDVILSYGGEPVFGPFSLRETNRLFPPGGEIVVQVNRDGEILEFTMGTDKVNRERSGIVNGMTLLPFTVKPD